MSSFSAAGPQRFIFPISVIPCALRHAMLLRRHGILKGAVAF
jgi:hypothetical protein